MKNFDHDLNVAVEDAQTEPNEWGMSDRPDALSLIALRDRLSAIIAENEREGRSERNDCPVVLEFKRGRNSWYIPVNNVWGGLMSVGKAKFIPLVGHIQNTRRMGERRG